MKQSLAAGLVLALLALGVSAAPPQDQPYKISVTTEVVLVNVVVRDKDGKPVTGLKRDDFVVTEDNKPQTIASFDFENIDSAALPAQVGPAQTVLDVRRPGVQKAPL